MKKIFSLILILVMSFSLYSCGGTGDNPDNDPNPAGVVDSVDPKPSVDMTGVHPAEFRDYICLYDYSGMQIPIDDNYLEPNSHRYSEFDKLKAGIDFLMKENLTVKDIQRLQIEGATLDKIAAYVKSIPDIIKFLDAYGFRATDTNLKLVENDGVSWGFSQPAELSFENREVDTGAFAQLVNVLMKGDTDRQGYQDLGGWKSLDTLNLFELNGFWYYCDIMDYWLKLKEGDAAYSPFVYITFDYAPNETDFYDFFGLTCLDSNTSDYKDCFERVHLDSTDFVIGGAYFKEGPKYPIGLSQNEHRPIWIYYPKQFEKAAKNWEDEAYMAREWPQVTGNVPVYFEMPDESTWPTVEDWVYEGEAIKLAAFIDEFKQGTISYGDFSAEISNIKGKISLFANFSYESVEYSEAFEIPETFNAMPGRAIENGAEYIVNCKEENFCNIVLTNIETNDSAEFVFNANNVILHYQGETIYIKANPELIYDYYLYEGMATIITDIHTPGAMTNTFVVADTGQSAEEAMREIAEKFYLQFTELLPIDWRYMKDIEVEAKSPDPEAESFVYNMYKESAKQPFHTYVRYTPGIYADNGGGNSGPRSDYPPEKFGETRVAEVEKTADGWKGGVYGTGW